MKKYLLLLIIFPSQAYCSGGHDDGERSTKHLEVKGPNGGKLLQKDGFAIEVTIFESGIPPEMRLYVYQNEQPVDPSLVTIKASLDRLGGAHDKIAFTAEKNYLVGDIEVVEPHSFDVTIDANFQNQSYRWTYDNHEGRAQISERLIKLSQIKTEKAGPKELKFTDTLFGVISIPNSKLFRLHAPYSGLVKQVHVQIGEKVDKGQRLATLQNTQTLQEYYLQSPSAGEISNLLVNSGDKADQSALIEMTDLSEVWVDLSAFPENIERLAIGQPVEVYDLHHHLKVNTKISYIAPRMTGGHIARARAVVTNEDGHWRPGMHIKADIETKKKFVPMAVKASAIQNFRDMPVVFAKFGNTFEVRMVQLGSSDGEYIEVIGGIEVGTEYVVENSFLLKAEILKDGASHDH
jgi:cobalt-zinc-cadmium efflux system membrane fusion protein